MALSRLCEALLELLYVAVVHTCARPVGGTGDPLCDLHLSLCQARMLEVLVPLPELLPFFVGAALTV